MDVPLERCGLSGGQGGIGGSSSMHALDALGGLRPVAQQVFKAAAGGVISCGVLLAADGVAGAHELNGGGVCSCSAPLAEGKVVLVQGGCRLSDGEGSHGGFSLLRARRLWCSAGRCCWWAAGAQGRRHALVRVPLDVWSMVLVLGVQHMVSKQWE